MATFNSIAGFQSVLQRKALVGAILVAPSTATAIDDIMSGTGGTATLTIDAAYLTLGKLSADGVTFGDAVTKQETRGYGDIYPSRIDVASEDANLSFTGIETNKALIDEFYGVDQTTISPGTTGTITFDKPPLPLIRDRRVLALFKDNNADGTGEIYLGIHFPRANITQNGDQTYAFTDAGLGYPMQASALLDETEGTAVRLFWSGPGLASLLAGMGYS
jgi:hypothetical protein